MFTLLDPKNDYVFKRLFAGEPELTVALINDLRPDLPRVVSVEILNPNIEAAELTGKGVALDVRARRADGHEYNIEMQVQRQRVGIHLLDFDLFVSSGAQWQQALWRFEMRDANLPDVLLGSELQLAVIELRKAGRLGRLQGTPGDWVRFPALAGGQHHGRGNPRAGEESYGQHPAAKRRRRGPAPGGIPGVGSHQLEAEDWVCTAGRLGAGTRRGA